MHRFLTDESGRDERSNEEEVEEGRYGGGRLDISDEGVVKESGERAGGRWGQAIASDDSKAKLKGQEHTLIPRVLAGVGDGM